MMRLFVSWTTCLLALVVLSADGFVVMKPTSTARPLFSTPTKQKDAVMETTTEPPLSELDARVLKEMLADTDKLDLQEEENMKKLLERGVTKNAPSLETPAKDEEDDSAFSSTVFKTLANTKLWKGLKRDASNILESVGIFVVNRIERDAKLLASVGLFAWERAVRDVARALPAAGTTGAAVGRAVRQASRQLGNSSSYEVMQQEQAKSLQDTDNLYEELNTPMDEIRSVSQSIRDILKGETVATSTSRNLRSVAPAGQAQNTERQKRAYRRRRVSKLQQEREVINIPRAATAVIDTAAEMRRELQVESSIPGYRSEGARKAIAAGAAETKRMLEAAKRDGWSRALFGTTTDDVKQDNIRELVGSEDIETAKEEADAQAVVQLLEEQSRVVERLKAAIQNPSETWLTPDVIGQTEGVIDEDGLRAVVSAMICARDELEVAEEVDVESLSASEMVNKLRLVKGTVDSISSLAASCAGMLAGERLSSILYGTDEEGASERTSLLTLDEVEPSIAAAVEAVESVPEVEDVRVVEAEVFTGDPVERTVVAEVVSDGTSRVKASTRVAAPHRTANGQEVYFTDFDKQTVEVESPQGTRMASVEVISDDDFDSAVGAKKVAVSNGEEEEEKRDEDVVGFVVLRSIDIVVFLVEKLFTTAIPNAITLGSTVSRRLINVGRDGMGSRGWERLTNTENGSKRY